MNQAPGHWLLAEIRKSLLWWSHIIHIRLSLHVTTDNWWRERHSPMMIGPTKRSYHKDHFIIVQDCEWRPLPKVLHRGLCWHNNEVLGHNNPLPPGTCPSWLRKEDGDDVILKEWERCRKTSPRELPVSSSDWLLSTPLAPPMARRGTSAPQRKWYYVTRCLAAISQKALSNGVMNATPANFGDTNFEDAMANRRALNIWNVVRWWHVVMVTACALGHLE